MERVLIMEAYWSYSLVPTFLEKDLQKKQHYRKLGKKINKYNKYNTFKGKKDKKIHSETLTLSLFELLF